VPSRSTSSRSWCASTSNVRIGIDVGGTFTDVVAVDAATRALLAAVKVPTTHDHPDGVAAGIVAGLAQLLREHAIDPATVAFIAHSTTQATNALLEGDVARVGVVRFGPAPARAAMRFAPVQLAAEIAFDPVYFDAPAEADDAWFARAGVDAFAASEAFGVDRPEREAAFVAGARARGFAATCGSEVSAMYGLRARTRTAALNAAILPRMLRTARMTRSAVDAAGIPAPLMIMRSDGGVMDVAEVERRPILTMLSGPAAGIAGALFHENVTDAIFIEVGGTSADCSVIRRGRPQVRPARIGGHRTLLRTLDVRTLAIAGGSLAHVARGSVNAVGPRSAHIAGYRYAAFCDVATIARAQVVTDGGIAALADGETRIALTPTCAANALGLVPAGAFASGDAEAARAACARVGATLGMSGDELARAILERATATLRATIDELIADYELDRATVVLVGGGGGAAALIPYAAQALGFEHRIARDAEVISPLGVALALVQDVVERTIVDPSPDDLVRVRREAIDAAIRSGAAPNRIEVALDVDRARNRVRAVASGATALAEDGAARAGASEEERLAAAARALRAETSALRESARTPAFVVVAAGRALAVVDERAVVRLIAARATVALTTAAGLPMELARAIEAGTTYGDVGRALPDLWLLTGARIVELSGLAAAEDAARLAVDDIAGLAPDAPIAIITAPRQA
jgi:N-methylhydantoinase A/oxoprolinase/acetone carboxylase beta subunit